MSDGSRVTCIIGAGASGIAGCRALQERGLPFVCYEAGAEIGGLWAFRNSNGRSSAYRSLHINTSKRQMAYGDYPLPEDYPDFPHHAQIAQYFRDYVERFGLAEHLQFDSEVTTATRTADGGWHVTLADGRARDFDALIVANGHHWDPKWPEPPLAGEFDGPLIHSHDYVDPTEPIDLHGKAVVVLGMGNSAMDIACELGHKGNADRVYLAARSGVHVMPKYFGDKVLDHIVRYPLDRPRWYEYLLHLLPYRARRRMTGLYVEHLIRRTVGHPESVGLPRPRHRFDQAHPTISAEIHNRLGNGDVLVKPGIERLEGDRIRFADGSVEQVDAVICATGYKISFPFFDARLLSIDSNRIELFNRIVDPRFDNLFFVGLVQPLCAIMPIAQLQAQWVAACLSGEYRLPATQGMLEAIRRDRVRLATDYVASSRHTIQIDCMEYSWELNREMKAGRRRARRRHSHRVAKDTPKSRVPSP